METNWYVVKVLPGKERSLREQFNKEISLGKIKNILRFICPTEKETIEVRNKKVFREKVLYKGYLYFETEKKLNPEDLKVISAIPNIMGMLGDKMPLLLSNNDVNKILKDEILNEYNESKKLKFEKNDKVKVVDGPFQSFDGTISDINGDKVELEIKIFGRITIVELTIKQIEKL
jgi:transcriptional antiterminator NusG